MRFGTAPEVTSDPDRPDRLEAAFRGDAAFAVLDAEPIAATLEAAIAGLDPEHVAIIRIRNPLVAPLSAERVMLQLAPEEVDENGLVLDEASRLLRAITAGAAGRPCLLVVVEQAETLTASGLALLQLLPGLQRPGGNRVRVAFLGGVDFYTLLEDPRFSAIRDHGTEQSNADEPAVLYGTGTAVAPSLLPAHRPSGKRRFLVVVGAASVAAAVLLVVAMRPSRTPEVSTAPVTVALEAPALPPPPRDDLPPPLSAGSVAAVPPSPAIIPAEEPPLSSPAGAAPPLLTPSIVAEDPVAARTRMFREFDAFVKTRGFAGRLSRSDREALFQEYLVRRYNADLPGSTSDDANRPEATAVSETPEVLLFFQANVPGVEALAVQNAAKLRRQVPDVTLSPVPDSLPDPIVKYFRPEDRDLALAVALALLPAATEWKVMDMAGAPGRRARATIEVWLPRPPVVP